MEVEHGQSDAYLCVGPKCGALTGFEPVDRLQYGVVGLTDRVPRDRSALQPDKGLDPRPVVVENGVSQLVRRIRFASLPQRLQFIEGFDRPITLQLPRGAHRMTLFAGN